MDITYISLNILVQLSLCLDSGMIVVIFICLGYLLLVFALLFLVKNEWCDLLFRNMTVRGENKYKTGLTISNI